MNYEIIYDLDENSFYLFGGIYLYKVVKDETVREEIKKQDIIERGRGPNTPPLTSLGYGSYLTAYNSNLESILKSDTGSRSVFQNKVRGIYNDLLNDDVDNYDDENIEKQKDQLLGDTISSDDFIIIPRSGLVGNDLVDIDKSSIIVLRISEEVNLGFIVDKAVLEIIGYNKPKENNNG